MRLLLLFLLASFLPVVADNSSPRQRLSADNNWKFLLGDPAHAQDPEFDDSSWRSVDLPHDWAIEGKTFDVKSPTGDAEGFLPEGIGFYRRTFQAPASWQGKKVMVEFEGVYMNAHVWLNGEDLGTHPYGYTGFYFDLTPHLKIGASNVLAVRVDDSGQKNSRWYSGAGIYRHVWFTVTGPVHVAPWGVFVQTPTVSDSMAKVTVQTQITNEGADPASVTLRTVVLDPHGARIADASNPASIAAGATSSVTTDLTIPNPSLWSLENPQLCRAFTQVIVGGRVIDQVQTDFGIRTVAWTAAKGFQLNGKTIKLCGGCAHNDLGCIGAASFDRAETRRVELLKAAGFNALRLSHNPPAPALLDACDRLGLLVMDEAFDCWNDQKNAYDYHLYFKDWWQRDVDSWIRHDRNHPSVVFWSIGNEIPNALDPAVVKTAKQLTDAVRALDPSRPLTEAIPFTPNAQTYPQFDLLAGYLDVIGCNYNLDHHTEYHQRNSSWMMMATESFPHDLFRYWGMARDNSYVLGDFVWTAMDYLGESGIGRWDLDVPSRNHWGAENFPWHGAYCGDIDIDGVRKPVSHYRDIVWDRGEKLFLSVNQALHPGHKINLSLWADYPAQASWTWPGFENNPIHVNVYSRYDSVQLYLNDKLIGEKPTTRNQEFKADFDLPYAPGTLKAVGMQKGAPVETRTLTTAGPDSALSLTADHNQLRADGQDLSYITVKVIDQNKQLDPNAVKEVHFSLTGPGVIQGVGNSQMDSMEPYQGNQRQTFQGLALVVIRTTHQPGVVTLTAHADGLADASVSLQANPAPAQTLLP